LAARRAAKLTQAEVASEMMERNQDLIQHLSSRPSMGATHLLELRLIEGSLIGLQQSTRELIQRRDETRIELLSLLGFPQSHPLQIDSTIDPSSLSLPELKTLVLSGLSHNLPLQMRILELEKAAKGVTAAQLDIAPDFTVGPFLSQDHAGEREQNFGGTLSLTPPLELESREHRHFKSTKK
jgi:cobalt-zinc-cadmium efflux system outer membrane protein